MAIRKTRHTTEAFAARSEATEKLEALVGNRAGNREHRCLYHPKWRRTSSYPRWYHGDTPGCRTTPGAHLQYLHGACSNCPPDEYFRPLCPMGCRLSVVVPGHIGHRPTHTALPAIVSSPGMLTFWSLYCRDYCGYTCGTSSDVAHLCSNLPSGLVYRTHRQPADR